LNYDAIIIGGGPAGSSASISLASRGARVLVLEEKRMPRGKLCGEFITPECFPSLERLGVLDQMLLAGATKITQVCLITSNGKSVRAQVSKMSNDSRWAMSLSRARFDQILFDRARDAGAECVEAIAVKGCLFNDGHPRGVDALSLGDGKRVTFRAPIIIDASGRNSRLMLRKSERNAGRRGSRLYALKAHLAGVDPAPESVELFFFPQGYGGLARVEEGLVNLCFIVDERTLKTAGGDPQKVIEASLDNNRIARERLRAAEVVGKWHSAGPLTFGRRRLTRKRIIAIGDASGMIDPFTGTGIQIALRSGEMAAEAVLEALGEARPWTTQQRGSADKFDPAPACASIVDSVLTGYSRLYDREFTNRMKTAGLLRVAAFSPTVASMFASVLTRAPALTSLILRATRSGGHAETARN